MMKACELRRAWETAGVRRQSVAFCCAGLIMICAKQQALSNVHSTLQNSEVSLSDVIAVKLAREVFDARGFAYFHLRPSKPFDGQRVGPNDTLGTVLPFPEEISERYNRRYRRSLKLYRSRKYERAADILKDALSDEPENPFLLNQYARSLFWTDNRRFESYSTYKRLLGVLDQQTGPRLVVKSDRAQYWGQEVVIDYWFGEAYWKVASLHLDRGEYASAVYEIARFWMTVGRKDLEQSDGQVFEYLAEAYWHLKNYVNARYYATIALLVDPGNSSARDYMGQ